jgi:uncharacterized RDD family membrane protein YckC
VLPPPIGTAYAGVGIRFLALILDLLPLLAFGLILFGPVLGDMLAAMVDTLPVRPRPGQPTSPEMQAALTRAIEVATPGLLRASALFQVCALLYFAGSWWAFSRTPAMALVGLRIVREEDGGRLGLGRVVVRYGGFLVSASVFLIGLIWAIFDNRKQGWHDKLAGTVVVRLAPEPAVAAPVDEGPPAAEVLPHRRPSIGAVADAAWVAFRRAPLDLIASLAVVLIPAAIILLPLVALHLIAQQDQAVLTFQFIGDAFNVSTDPASYARFVEYNRLILASTAPLVVIGALTGLVGSIMGALLVGACAAAVNEERRVRPAGIVARILVQRLPALLTLGVAAGVLFALGYLLLGLPAISAASADTTTFDPNRATLGAVFGTLVLIPLAIYFGGVWLMAVVCVVREELGPVAALKRAWRLSRGRMRWLIGVLLATGLAAYAILGPVGLLPVGLLAEDYIEGGRLPVGVSVVTFGLLVLLASPLLCLTFVEAYRAARDDAAAGSGR